MGDKKIDMKKQKKSRKITTAYTEADFAPRDAANVIKSISYSRLRKWITLNEK